MAATFTPGAAVPAGRPNPRRPPAHRSVSLLHGQKRRSSSLQDSDSSGENAVGGSGSQGNSKQSNSPSSLQPQGRGSSGESSNADRWFDESNNEVRDNDASFADNDPPFFMRNNSSASQTPPDRQQQSRQADPAMNVVSMPQHFRHVATDGSSTEDYRGVIDDLTIENKKLKKRLKKYEKLHDAHLRDEKLFEVRFHGLPPDKKSELEETLQKFAASLGTNGFLGNGYEGIMPSLLDKNASPMPQTDSAYASHASRSASGPGSSARSGNSGSQTAALRRENIHSYLHHIPEGLLPQVNPTNMTERAKQKLVVRRLEQIFAGKGAAIGGHQHPRQQQEVSQMAARADKAQNGPSGRSEGDREAPIMTEEGEEQANLVESTINAESPFKGHASPWDASVDKENKNPEQGPAQQPGPVQEQRPTRPLDLDPHRAQVPSENMRYIRHLGFSPSAPDEERGWVYLNLLINMAQLHTINVTTEFVRKAVASHSSKFEVSADGRKVRWKGSASLTRGSSKEGGSTVGADTPDGESPRKRPKLAHRESYRSQVSNTESKLVYTPMFWNRSSSDGADYTSEEEDNMSASGQAPIAGTSSGLTSTGMRIAAPRRKQRDDGPIIFYQNACFCTDLSGDPGAQYNRNAPLYVPATELALGEPQTDMTGKMAEKRGPLAHASELPAAMDLSDNPIPESMEISFPPPCDLIEDREKPQPISFEVSGIGGVWPSDHFAIDVESRHVGLDQEHKPQNSRRQPLPSKFANILQHAPARSSFPASRKQIMKSSRTDLAPSELPPALGFVSQDDDFEDSDMDDDDMSISPVSDNGSVPAAMPQPVQLHYVGSDEEDEYDDDMDDGESDGSVDLLATAREQDPEAIRMREREYDANMAERLAEEIPAGSSAATAGGGSGFGSPSHGVSREDYHRALAEHRERRDVLRRSTTADSMRVQVQGPTASSSDGEDEDEDEDEDMRSIAS